MRGPEPWPGGKVPLLIPETMKGAERAFLEDAVSLWLRSPHVIIFERTVERAYVEVVRTAGADSKIGYTGQPQPLCLPHGFGLDLALHELGHVLGLHHEHTRYDRDDYIEVFPENVHFGLGPAFFAIEPRRDDVRPYDFASVMHYAPDQLAKPGRVTFRARPGKLPTGVRIGRWTEPSRGDLESLAILYDRSG